MSGEPYWGSASAAHDHEAAVRFTVLIPPDGQLPVGLEFLCQTCPRVSFYPDGFEPSHILRSLAAHRCDEVLAEVEARAAAEAGGKTADRDPLIGHACHPTCGPCRAIAAGLAAAALPAAGELAHGGERVAEAAPPWRRPAHPEAALAMHMLADHFARLRDDASDSGCTTPLYSGVDVWDRAERMARDCARSATGGWWPEDWPPPSPDTRTAGGSPPADTSWITFGRLRERFWPWRR